MRHPLQIQQTSKTPFSAIVCRKANFVSVLHALALRGSVSGFLRIAVSFVAMFSSGKNRPPQEQA